MTTKGNNRGAELNESELIQDREIIYPSLVNNLTEFPS